jgi:type IV fimbrial biogenesis protein FimT
MKTRNGFTLVELIITLLIASLLLFIGIPSLVELLRDSRITASTNQLMTSLHLMRSDAVKRSQQVSMIKTGANWENGWILIEDQDRDGVMDDGEVEIAVFAALEEGYTLRTGAHFDNWLAYREDGESRGNSGANDTFRLCADDQDVADGRSIIVNLTGRVRMQEGVASCP